MPGKTLLCFCWIVSAATSAEVVIEVERDRVRAEDLASGMPAWRQAPGPTELLYSPAPGVVRYLGRTELERLAFRHGITATEWPARVAITRKVRTLEAAEAEAALAASIAERYHISPEDVAVELAGFHAPQIPAGQMRFRSTGVFPRPREIASIPLTWITGERRSGTLWLRARIEVRGPYALARRAIEPNRSIGPGDIEYAEGPLPGPPDRWSVTREQVAGRTVARQVAAGDKIQRSWLMGAKTVERGAVVELRLASGALELRAPGRAEQAGAIGQQVSFRNLQSGRRVTARVVNARQAEVAPQGESR